MTAIRTVLITGGSGYLGRNLTARATGKFQVYAAYHTHPDEIRAGQPILLDLTSRDGVLRQITHLSPSAIIHTAAINPGHGRAEDMERINIDGTRYIAEGAQIVGARLIHVSSDVVHDGQNAPYPDEASPAPINAYGRSKAAAEAVVTKTDSGAAIVRTSLIYGLQEIDRGTRSFIDRLETGQPLVLFNDVLRQPVWIETLSEALLKLVDLDFAGILNVAGRQVLTREAFGRRLLTWWQIQWPEGQVRSGRAADISAATPLDLRLSVTKGEQLLQMRFPGVDEVLSRPTGK